MMEMTSAVDAQRFECPACGRYIGTADGRYVELPPCKCGIQTTIRVTGTRRLTVRNRTDRVAGTASSLETTSKL